MIIRNLGTGGRRHAEHYPAVPATHTGRRIFAWRVVIGQGFYKNMTWLKADDRYLHVSGLGPFRLWIPTFSVPLSDISATPDEYRWAFLDPHVIRLTFARDPSVRFLVWPDEFEKLIEASNGRLRSVEMAAHRSRARGLS
jgi:hypothetical protein